MFRNDKHSTAERKSVCERKRCCATCGLLVKCDSHECNERFCANTKENKDVGHLCFMRPLKDVLPSAGDKVLYVFYDFKTTQNKRYTDKATLHVPDLVCVQQFSSQCEDVEDYGDCVWCGNTMHSFWDDPVRDLHIYLCEPRPWTNKIVAFAHIAKAFDLHFILNSAITLKWKPEMPMNGIKIMCMKMDHLVFLGSVSFLPCALWKLPEAFGLAATNPWYPHYFNTEKNLDSVRPNPAFSYYETKEMREEERKEFLVWYESQRSEPFDDRSILETYSQDDVTILRQACQLFRCEFLQIGHIDLFVEGITVASACDKFCASCFLSPIR